MSVCSLLHKSTRATRVALALSSIGLFSAHSVSAQALPTPWVARDIGSPAIKGSTTYAYGTYTVNAAGIDIWNTSDQFQFVYQKVTGDVDVIVRVRSISQANSWSKTGVMIRESLSSGSRHAFALVSAARGYGFQDRIDPGGFSNSVSGVTGVAPGWVRLVRSGSSIQAFRSTNGTTWTSMGSDVVPMADTVYVGIATTSHNASRSTKAVLDRLKLTAVTAPPANQAPSVSLTAPANGATYTAPASVPLSATASDADGTIARVEFYAGATLLATDATAPYSYTWSSVAAGTYTLKAVAYDTSGKAATSATRSITVTAGTNKPPTVALTAPANGTKYTAPASVSLTATAADSDGSVAKVQFYSGSTLLGTDTTAPYAFTWGSVPAGTYSLTAVAYDNAGAKVSSAAASITVGSSTLPALPTAVAFHASADHATVTSYRLDIFASGANPATATPVVTANLGKPAPDANGDITVNEATLFKALAVGNYQATVTAIGSGGSSRSAAVAFTR
jgi:Big-like domain-containing protein